ncbi:hypothetical protein CR513_39534, partial [Mucuna pruriens]
MCNKNWSPLRANERPKKNMSCMIFPTTKSALYRPRWTIFSLYFHKVIEQDEILELVVGFGEVISPPTHPIGAISTFSNEKDILQGILKVDELEQLQSRVVLTLCHMEMLFPPFFSIVMIPSWEDLPILMGVSIERYLGKLKSYDTTKKKYDLATEISTELIQSLIATDFVTRCVILILVTELETEKFRR